MTDINTCLKYDPKFTKAYLRKGQIMLTMKEPIKAKEAFEAALKLDPNSSEAREGLL